MSEWVPAVMISYYRETQSVLRKTTFTGWSNSFFPKQYTYDLIESFGFFFDVRRRVGDPGGPLE